MINDMIETNNYDNIFSIQFILSIGSALFSPIFLMQTSVPWLEFLADKKYGHLEKYQQYKRSTSSYLIMPKR